MIKPALLVTWPVHIDYPWFRYNLHKFRGMFSAILVCFTNLNQERNYMNLIMKDIPFCKFTKPLEKEPDWRNDTVKTLLSLAPRYDYYLFIEQDFLIKSIQFWRRVLEAGKDFVYLKEEERIHPAFALVKRDLIDKTSCDFAAHPDDLGLDHFGKFFKEVQQFDQGVSLRQLGLVPKQDYYHMNGVSQNYGCAERGETLYRKDEFLCYNYNSMLLPYQIPFFFKRMLDIAEKYGYDEKENWLSMFFPEE